MAKVVYRGIEYDTQKRLEYQQQMAQQPQQYNENYRGVRFVKEGHKRRTLMCFNFSKRRSRKKIAATKHN